MRNKTWEFRKQNHKKIKLHARHNSKKLPKCIISWCNFYGNVTPPYYWECKLALRKLNVFKVACKKYNQKDDTLFWFHSLFVNHNGSQRVRWMNHEGLSNVAHLFPKAERERAYTGNYEWPPCQSWLGISPFWKRELGDNSLWSILPRIIACQKGWLCIIEMGFVLKMYFLLESSWMSWQYWSWQLKVSCIRNKTLQLF